MINITTNSTRKHCEICGRAFKQGEKSVETISSSYNGHNNVRSMCKGCFLEIVYKLYPEVLKKKIREEIESWIIANKI